MAEEKKVAEPEVKEPEVKEPEVKEPEVKEPEGKLLTHGEQSVLDDLDRDRPEGTEKEPEKKEPEVKEPEKKEEVDDGGVSWKNRAKESERKHNELLEKMGRGEFNPPPTPKTQAEVRESIVKKLQTQYPDLEEAQLNAMVDVAVDISGGMVSHATQTISPVMADFHIETAKKKIGDTERKFINEHSVEIDEVINQIPVQSRLNSQGANQALQNAILHVKGKIASNLEGNFEDRVKAAVDEALKNKRIVSDTVEGSAGAGGGKTKTSKLTPEQQKDASEKGLDSADYLSILKRRQASAKAKGLTIPEILG